MSKTSAGNFFEDFRVGATILHATPRTITAGDVSLYTALYRAYRTMGPVVTAEIKSSQDGITRLNSFRRLSNYPLFVGAALSKDEILAEWWNETRWHTGGVDQVHPTHPGLA